MSWKLGAMIYVAGLVCGLLMGDARPLERFVLALLWPLGPVAFVVTIAILLAASVIAFPIFGVPLALVLGALWWAFS